VLVRADASNAARVYRALGAFGAPLQTFEVSEDDFASYDGVLQIGLPPRRIDILNRADGITFDEAISDGACFEWTDGKSIIGLAALLKNKRTARRAQDLATSRPRVEDEEGVVDRSFTSSDWIRRPWCRSRRGGYPTRTRPRRRASPVRRSPRRPPRHPCRTRCRRSSASGTRGAGDSRHRLGHHRDRRERLEVDQSLDAAIDAMSNWLSSPSHTFMALSSEVAAVGPEARHGRERSSGWRSIHRRQGPP